MAKTSKNDVFARRRRAKIFEILGPKSQILKPPLTLKPPPFPEAKIGGRGGLRVGSPLMRIVPSDLLFLSTAYNIVNNNYIVRGGLGNLSWRTSLG